MAIPQFNALPTATTNGAQTLWDKKTSSVQDAPTVEKPAGWSFSSNLKAPEQQAKVSKMMNQNAGDQITFAQKILLQQLKHQFPGNEFDANKMVESLMGMLQIAQNSQLNDTQQKSLDLNTSMINYQLASLQGKVVERRSDTFDYQGKDQTISYSLPADMKKVGVYVYMDGDESPIFAQEADRFQGEHAFVWNGKMQNGEAAPHGLYNVFIRALDNENQDVPTDARLHSEITGIDYSQGPLGVPLAGSIPILNFNRMLTPYNPVIQNNLVNAMGLSNVETIPELSTQSPANNDITNVASNVAAQASSAYEAMQQTQ